MMLVPFWSLLLSATFRGAPTAFQYGSRGYRQIHKTPLAAVLALDWSTLSLFCESI